MQDQRSGAGLIPSAYASRILAEPGRNGFCWLSCGAQPERKIDSKAARMRPPVASVDIFGVGFYLFSPCSSPNFSGISPVSIKYLLLRNSFAAVETAPTAKDILAFGARSTPSRPPAAGFLMSTFRFPLTLSWLAFIVALPLGIGAQPTMAHAQVWTSKDTVPTILTHGVASAEVVPDIAIISLGVDTERPKAAAAARDNARAMQTMIGEIKAQGIEAKDIKTLSVTLSPGYDEVHIPNGGGGVVKGTPRPDGTAIVSYLPEGYVTRKTLRGYIAHNSLSVRIRDIEKAGELAGELLDKGANSFEGIAFDYSQKDAKYNALLGDAVRDALLKANNYVSGLGLKLGRVLAIAPREDYSYSAGVGGYMPSAGKHAAAAVPIEPGSEVLRTEVQVTWELAQ
jgi:uncharacterized protein